MSFEEKRQHSQKKNKKKPFVDAKLLVLKKMAFVEVCKSTLKAADAQKTSLTYGHRVYSSCYLGKDLTMWLAKADKLIHQAVVSVANGILNGPAKGLSSAPSSSKASRFLEAIYAFLQHCVDLRLLVGVNKEEREFHADCFYVITELSADGGEREQTDKDLLGLVERLKRDLILRDRRQGLRSYNKTFLLSEASAILELYLKDRWEREQYALQEEGSGQKNNINLEQFHGERVVADALSRLQQENLIVCCAPPDVYQLVPRTVHQGYVYCSSNGTPGGSLVRRWALLRESSLLLFHDQRRHVLISEVDLTQATAESVDSAAFLWMVGASHIGATPSVSVVTSVATVSASRGGGGGGGGGAVAMASARDGSGNVPATPGGFVSGSVGGVISGGIGAGDHLPRVFTVTTATERLWIMTYSIVERNMWVDLLAPLNTVVAEENELITQAEAIITSTSFFSNNH